MKNFVKKFMVLGVVLSIGLAAVPQISSYAKPTTKNPYEFSTAKKNGNFIKVTKHDASNNLTGTEAYNVKNMDAFIANVNKKKKSSIRMIQYSQSSSKKYTIEKLADLSFDGKVIKYIKYNASSKKVEKSDTFDVVHKNQTSKTISYTICKGEELCVSLVSIKKDSIKK